MKHITTALDFLCMLLLIGLIVGLSAWVFALADAAWKHEPLYCTAASLVLFGFWAYDKWRDKQ